MIKLGSCVTENLIGQYLTSHVTNVHVNSGNRQRMQYDDKNEHQKRTKILHVVEEMTWDKYNTIQYKTCNMPHVTGMFVGAGMTRD